MGEAGIGKRFSLPAEAADDGLLGVCPPQDGDSGFRLGEPKGDAANPN